MNYQNQKTFPKLPTAETDLLKRIRSISAVLAIPVDDLFQEVIVSYRLHGG